ncbi:glycoside hydrolase family 131 protein, partial [Aureobasidium melanogenum]
FSLKRGTENAPDTTAEHQIAFFESHFTELKYGVDGSDGKLQWMTDGKSQFDMDFEADVWHNVAYGIDFDASTVEFFHSTGADKLVSKAGPMKASVSSNGADWHVGVLKFSKTKEDWFFSSVYIEDGELTTSISASGGDAPAKASSAPAASSSSTAAVSSKAPIVAPPSSAAAAQTTSSKAASSSATTVKSSASAVPTTLQTMTKPTSSLASVISSTAAAETAPSATDDAGCTVEYVYV